MAAGLNAPSYTIVYMAFSFMFDQSCAGHHVKELHDNLLTNYSLHVRPTDPTNITKPTNVGVSVRLLQIFELEEKSQVLASSVFVLQKWRDERLKWNLAECGNVTKVLFHPSQIWVPDIVVMNNAVTEHSGMAIGMSAPVHVSYNGDIVWYSNVIIKSYCKMKVKYFPFDEQFCSIKLSSWSYNETEVILIPAEAVTRMRMNYTENSAWTLEDIHLRVETTTLSFLNPRIPKTQINYVIHMNRKAFYYFVYLFAPCLLTSILMVMIFVLPPECGERMVVGITSMLALTVFFLLAAKNIPETSEDVPLMGRYYSLTLIEMSIALFCTSVVLRFHYSTSKMPKWVKVYILRRLARLVRIKTLQNTKVLMNEDPLISVQTTLKGSARALTIAPKEQGGDSEQNCQLDGRTIPLDGEDSGLVLMAEKLIEDAENEALQDEWKLAARVLNRFFLWLYITATVLSVGGIFVQTPGFIVKRAELPQ